MEALSVAHLFRSRARSLRSGANVRLARLVNGRLEEQPAAAKIRVRAPPLILASFCNVWPPGFHRAIIDASNGYFRWLHDSRELSPLDGTDGLCRAWNSDHMWSLDQRFGSATSLTRLTANGDWLSREDLPEIRDGHDLVDTASGLAVADTGHDRVMLRSQSGQWQRVWAAGESMSDTHHVNALALHQGALCATAFGPMPEGGWRHARSGYVVDCGRNRVIHEGIAHPHSLSSDGVSLWWCESALARVCRFDQAAGEPVIEAELRGYLRGLVVTRDHVIVAASARRSVSRHLGVTIPIPEEANHVSEAVLYVIDRQTHGVAIVNLGHLGAEVFALVLAPEAIPRPDEYSMMDGIKTRFSAASEIAGPA